MDPGVVGRQIPAPIPSPIHHHHRLQASPIAAPPAPQPSPHQPMPNHDAGLNHLMRGTRQFFSGLPTTTRYFESGLPPSPPLSHTTMAGVSQAQNHGPHSSAYRPWPTTVANTVQRWDRSESNRSWNPQEAYASYNHPPTSTHSFYSYQPPAPTQVRKDRPPAPIQNQERFPLQQVSLPLQSRLPQPMQRHESLQAPISQPHQEQLQRMPQHAMQSTDHYQSSHIHQHRFPNQQMHRHVNGMPERAQSIPRQVLAPPMPQLQPGLQDPRQAPVQMPQVRQQMQQVRPRHPVSMEYRPSPQIPISHAQNHVQNGSMAVMKPSTSYASPKMGQKHSISPWPVNESNAVRVEITPASQQYQQTMQKHEVSVVENYSIRMPSSSSSSSSIPRQPSPQLQAAVPIRKRPVPAPNADANPYIDPLTGRPNYQLIQRHHRAQMGLPGGAASSVSVVRPPETVPTSSSEAPPLIRRDAAPLDLTVKIIRQTADSTEPFGRGLPQHQPQQGLMNGGGTWSPTVRPNGFHGYPTTQYNPGRVAVSQQPLSQAPPQQPLAPSVSSMAGPSSERVTKAYSTAIHIPAGLTGSAPVTIRPTAPVVVQSLKPQKVGWPVRLPQDPVKEGTITRMPNPSLMHQMAAAPPLKVRTKAALKQMVPANVPSEPVGPSVCGTERVENVVAPVQSDQSVSRDAAGVFDFKETENVRPVHLEHVKRRSPVAAILRAPSGQQKNQLKSLPSAEEQPKDSIVPKPVVEEKAISNALPSSQPPSTEPHCRFFSMKVGVEKLDRALAVFAASLETQRGEPFPPQEHPRPLNMFAWEIQRQLESRLHYDLDSEDEFKAASGEDVKPEPLSMEPLCSIKPDEDEDWPTVVIAMNDPLSSDEDFSNSDGDGTIKKEQQSESSDFSSEEEQVVVLPKRRRKRKDEDEDAKVEEDDDEDEEDEEEEDDSESEPHANHKAAARRGSGISRRGRKPSSFTNNSGVSTRASAVVRGRRRGRPSRSQTENSSYSLRRGSRAKRNSGSEDDDWKDDEDSAQSSSAVTSSSDATSSSESDSSSASSIEHRPRTRRRPGATARAQRQSRRLASSPTSNDEDEDDDDDDDDDEDEENYEDDDRDSGDAKKKRLPVRKASEKTGRIGRPKGVRRVPSSENEEDATTEEEAALRKTTRSSVANTTQIKRKPGRPPGRRTVMRSKETSSEESLSRKERLKRRRSTDNDDDSNSLSRDQREKRMKRDQDTAKADSCNKDADDSSTVRRGRKLGRRRTEDEAKPVGSSNINPASNDVGRTRKAEDDVEYRTRVLKMPPQLAAVLTTERRNPVETSPDRKKPGRKLGSRLESKRHLDMKPRNLSRSCKKPIVALKSHVKKDTKVGTEIVKIRPIDGLPPGFTLMRKTRGRPNRRKYRSGFDYMRKAKKKKPLPEGVVASKLPMKSKDQTVFSTRFMNNMKKLEETKDALKCTGSCKATPSVDCDCDRNGDGGGPLVNSPFRKCTGLRKDAIPLRDAIQAEIKSWVINRGAGETPLHRAARLGYYDIALYCVEERLCDVDGKDNAGYSPLHEACSRGQLELARLLLEFGAEVNIAVSQGGIRPIHEALQNGHTEVVRLLLSYGADPTLATYSGLSPLALAKPHPELYEMLQRYLTDVSGVCPDPESSTDENQDKSASSCQTTPKKLRRRGELLKRKRKKDGESGEGKDLRRIELGENNAWAFYGSAKCLDPVNPGCDIFSVVPSTSETEEFSFDVECSSAPILDVFQISSERLRGKSASTNGAPSSKTNEFGSSSTFNDADKFLVLKEVLQRLDLKTKDQLDRLLSSSSGKRSPRAADEDERAQLLTLSLEDFHARAHCCRLGATAPAAMKKAPKTGDTVILVKYTAKLRDLLGIEVMNSYSDGDEIKISAQCKFCASIVLSPGNAVFTEFSEPVQLPSAEDAGKIDEETRFWKVDDIYKFTNVGFSKIVPKEIVGLTFIPSRYLACADCDKGPIGFCKDFSNSYVALSRVREKSEG